ncbi:CPBP family intramembrane glutamate endopeptidase [Streptococcus pneumoniae]
MIKARRVLQVGLLGACLQLICLLFMKPQQTQVGFQFSSFLFVVLLMGFSICYFCYFSRELTPLKLELKASYSLLFQLSYFMLVMVNVIGAYLLIGQQALGLSEQQVQWMSLFRQTSLFLVGFDLVTLIPLMSRWSVSNHHQKRVLLAVFLVFLVRNPAGLLCFLFYTGLGYGFSRLAQKTGIGRELSFLSHIVRDSILLGLLLMIW